MKRMITNCLLMCMTLNAFAVSHKMDCHSKTVKYQAPYFMLNVQNNFAGPKLYFIKNFSKHTILLDHPLTQDPSAKAGWPSYLKPKHLSALLLNRRNFAINCALQTPNKANPLAFDCRKFIDICLATSTIDPALSGNYWFIENQPQDVFFAKVQKRLKGF